MEVLPNFNIYYTRVLP